MSSIALEQDFWYNIMGVKMRGETKHHYSDKQCQRRERAQRRTIGITGLLPAPALPKGFVLPNEKREDPTAEKEQRNHLTNIP